MISRYHETLCLEWLPQRAERGSMPVVLTPPKGSNKKCYDNSKATNQVIQAK